jgi:hypothetical protein
MLWDEQVNDELAGEGAAERPKKMGPAQIEI